MTQTYYIVDVDMKTTEQKLEIFHWVEDTIGHRNASMAWTRMEPDTYQILSDSMALSIAGSIFSCMPASDKILRLKTTNKEFALKFKMRYG